jgi:iron(III) transport system ATP-binding protein
LGNVVLQNVEKRYGHTIACTGINLEIQKGSFFALLGPSGCGKTTLLRLIAGLIRPDRGAILLDGVDITALEPEKRKVGMVFQNYALFPFMTVRENIEYGLKVQRRTAADREARTAACLSMVGLDGFENRNISELSGGEQQRVALARSLVVEPRVLLLDEPLSNLDARLRDAMRQELKKLQKNLGITTIFVTHDQTEALTMSDRIAVFNQGVCKQVGTPQEIYHAPRDAFVAGFVGETNLFPLRFTDGYHYLPNDQRIDIPEGNGARFLSIRPQDLCLSTGPLDCDHCFTGTIEDQQYNGLSCDYVIRADNLLFQAVTISRADTPLPFSVGQVVNIGFSASDIRLLEH